MFKKKSMRKKSFNKIKKVKKCSPKKRSRKASRKELSRKVKNCSKNKKHNSREVKRSTMNWDWRKFFNTKSYQRRQEQEREQKEIENLKEEIENLKYEIYNQKLDDNFFNLKNFSCNFCINQQIDTRNQALLDNIIFNSIKKELEFKFDDDDNDKKLKIKIDHKKEYTFTILKNSIGKGTAGEIYQLYNSDYKVAYALKIEQNPTEIEISEFLDDKYCNLLKVKYIGYNYARPNYLMELADGDLNTLADKLHSFIKNNKNLIQQSRAFFRDVAEEIRKQMVCLLVKSEYKYVYVDIKLENILYKCIKGENKGENKVKIFLGDLGSAVSSKIKPNFYTHTFKPFEYKTNTYFRLYTNDQKEQILSWMIGIILLSFINSNYAYDNLSATAIDEDNIKYETIKENVYLMLSENYGDQFVSYLDSNPTKRPSIFKPLPEI